MWFAFFSCSLRRGFSSRFPFREPAFADPSLAGDDVDIMSTIVFSSLLLHLSSLRFLSTLGTRTGGTYSSERKNKAEEGYYITSAGIACAVVRFQSSQLVGGDMGYGV
jgi:hypothetical protein